MASNAGKLEFMSKVFELIEKEEIRQREVLEMIPSENYASKNVLKALGSILTDKYSEGFPGKRYYGGNEVIDEIERYAESLANQLFGTKLAFVQPYSGSPANNEVLMALVEPGQVVMGLKLTSGGHLTHGSSLSFADRFYKAVTYTVKEDGKIDFEDMEHQVLEHKPKLIWVGTTAYPYILDYDEFRRIADLVGAYLVADIAHIAGLIIGGAHPSPVQYVDVITTTTHKALRGPRGAMILVTERGLDKDPDMKSKIEKAIIPGFQGGPHNHQTAAIAIALEEASQPSFQKYINQVVKNAKVLSKELNSNTETHLINLDLSSYGFGLGYQAQIALEEAGIVCNRNTVPGELASAFYPSGIRLGTPALTSRGMKEEDMKKIAIWIKQVLEEIKGFNLPSVQEERKDFIKAFKIKMKENENLKKIKQEVSEFVSKFPLPGIDF